MVNRWFVVGGAGFIGDHLVVNLEADGQVDWLIYDIRNGADAADLSTLARAMAGCDTVVHLASNADIARAATDPTVDFDEGTLLTHNVLEAMRLTGASRLLYASGSGVYGDLSGREVDEDYGPLRPISTYGASKLAGEAMISAYCHLFGMAAVAFRFANVVGPRQTHGVGYDFLNQLAEHPDHLTIRGDGRQSKPYLHVDDAVAAMLAVPLEAGRFDVYNVAPGNTLTVHDIAAMAANAAGMAGVSYSYTGGDRGWAGDVPHVRLDTARIRATGWKPSKTSRQAMQHALAAMWEARRDVAVR